MSDDEWDSENFVLEEPTQPARNLALVPDRWEGEDEEDEVKESWEDDDDQEKKPEPEPEVPKAIEVKKESKLMKKIAERERKEKEAAELKRQEREQENGKEMTPEEKQDERLRQLRLQQDADLLLTRETFGIPDAAGLDAMEPNTKEEFDEFRKTLIGKIQRFERSDNYGDFAEEFIHDLCLTLPSARLSKIKVAVGTLQQEKAKVEKQTQPKKATKGKSKARLHVDNEKDLGDYTYNEYDDFI